MYILPNDTLALAIDIQEKLIPAVESSEDFLCQAKKLLKGLSVLKIPILFTEQYPKGIGGTPAEVLEAVGEKPAVLEKASFSAFADETIRRHIEMAGRKTILLFGIEAHVCVLQTLISLREEGYQVVFIEDAVSSRTKADKECALARAMYEGAVPSSVEAVLFELCHTSARAEFKEILQIVK